MGKYLLKVEETYRVDNEAEAAALIEEAKKDNHFELAKYTSVKRQRKVKGEIEDEWVRTTLTKIFDDEKEPIGSASISYNTSGSAF
jgi:ferritin-like metal-binding protein YciE